MINISKSKLEHIHAALIEIKACGGKQFGICASLIHEARAVDRATLEDWLHDVFAVWPKFSGNIDYPIAVSFDPRYDYGHCRGRWDRHTAYGALRWELLDFCIEQAEQQLNSMKDGSNEHTSYRFI